MKKTKQTNEEKELMKMKKAELVNLIQIYKGTVDLVESDSRDYINELETGMALERAEWAQEEISLSIKYLEQQKRLYTRSAQIVLLWLGIIGLAIHLAYITLN